MIAVVVDEVIERRRTSRELDDAVPLPVLDAYLRAQMAELKALAGEQPESTGDDAVLDDLFRATLWRLWPETSAWR